MTSPPYTVAFRLELPFGHCVGLHLPERDATPPRALLHADEIARAEGLAARRQITWFGGRAALRMALGDLGAEAGAIASNDRGAPVLPDGLAGSISHKEGLAVALVAPRAGWELGVDVESVTPTTQDIARHVLTDEEQTALAVLSDDDRRRSVLLRFSAKEALYKALDPYVRRFVGFKEVEASAEDDAIAFRLALGPAEGPFETEGHWLERDDFFLTSARVRHRV